MKLLILFLISFSAFANYIPQENIGVCPSVPTVFTSPNKCQEHYSKPCFKIPQDYNCAIHSFIPETWLKEQAQACLDSDDCQAKFESLVCESEGFSPIKNLDQLEVYCTKLRPANVAVDEAKKAAYDAQKAQEDAFKNAIAAAKKAMQCGQDVKALLVVRNAAKNLNTTQIKQMVATYSEIDALLSSGSLVSAKEEILAINPDGVLVTADDKTALVAKIDKCLE